MQTGFINNSRWLDKTRAIIILGSMLLAAFLIISWTSYEVAKESLEEEIEENTLPLTSDNVYSEIQQDLLKPIFISSLMAHDTFLRDWVLNDENDPQAMFRYLREIDRRFDTVFSFFISDKSKRYYDPLRILKTVSEDSPDDRWYFQHRTLSDEMPYAINISFDPENRSRLDILINHKVVDYDGNFIGITGVGIPVERVKHLINKYEQRYNRTIYFVDKEGNITLHGESYSRPVKIQQQPGLSNISTMILTAPGGAYEYQSNGEHIFLNTRLLPEFGWYLMVEQISHPSEKRLLSTLLKNLGISAFVSILFLFLLWLTIGGYQRRLEQMATTDKLTGLMNRQAFDYLFHRLGTKSVLQHKSLSILLIDIDHFKKINDQYGHNVGDLVLQEISALLSTNTRSSDRSCRWGGEEFVILLDNCDINAAQQRAEALRQSIEITHLPYREGTIQVTVSCGVAEYRAGETLSMLINRADIALYQAKQQGRNRVVRAV
ncbi:sensor domain-containing diguanylate cyclase [Pectobacterium parmentieri]|uniref:sensor domain-containing diguanylate cyclase n=1 Tax=Pectobacterium parmentieri TaxID=1905730 RepID=UPI000EB47DD0|nr:sensor domain-containing diguanylate cyclase [Pectobacterium parmentieri]AYH06401.1 diguanylate cyclase [Pectobacterium parmentieri]AYH23919.1 diguanylate cyclase [Pectobacterium parmentieri]MBN3176856.1 GGDEF domain-containing protein [Pectobacterium parmentieri]QRN28499.1 GGDEF domain-containing protein [Pectobacterium parmentieri]